MWTHERDVVSLMSGLLLVLVATLFLLHDATAVELDGRWVAPVVLLAVGAVGMLATLRHHDRDRDDTDLGT